MYRNFFLPRFGQDRRGFYLSFLSKLGMKGLSRMKVRQLEAIYIKERKKGSLLPTKKGDGDGREKGGEISLQV